MCMSCSYRRSHFWWDFSWRSKSTLRINSTVLGLFHDVHHHLHRLFQFTFNRVEKNIEKKKHTFRTIMDHPGGFQHGMNGFVDLALFGSLAPEIGPFHGRHPALVRLEERLGVKDQELLQHLLGESVGLRMAWQIKEQKKSMIEITPILEYYLYVNIIIIHITIHVYMMFTYNIMFTWFLWTIPY